MTYSDWREPARLLRAETGPPSGQLLEVAEALGCPHHGEPHGVLAAIIEEYLAPVLHGSQPRAATDKQLEFLANLGHISADGEMNRVVASAWIDHHLAVKTVDALERLQLTAGDQVHLRSDYVDAETGEVTDIGGVVTVSSIGRDGLVYFRGGNGQCAWPTRLSRIAVDRPG